MNNTIGVILAAGEGTRMRNSYPKVLHEVGGEPMIFYSIRALREMGIEDIYVVVGYKEDEVKTVCSDKEVEFITQNNLLGTADAVKKVIQEVDIRENSNIILLYGDFPLIRSEHLKGQINFHNSKKSICTIASSKVEGKEKEFREYGKIIRDKNNRVLEIKEKDELSFPDKYSEINLGIYCFRYCRKLKDIINTIKPSEKGEYYLTTAVELLREEDFKILCYEFEDPREFVGINTQKDVARANEIMYHRKVEELMDRGVTVIAPANTFIHEKAKIAQNTVVYPNVIIENEVEIGRGCSIGPNCRLRAETVLEEGVEIGNFAEIVRSHVKKRVKIKHFSYIGDAVIEENVNIGAGTITANYDGKNKNVTVIKKGAFIGSGTILIAPVTVGEGATTGAGSVLPKGKDVSPESTVVGIPARRLKK